MSKASPGAKKSQQKRREINLQCMRRARSDPEYREWENMKRKKRLLQKRIDEGLGPPRRYNKRQGFSTGSISHYSENESQCSSIIISDSPYETKPTYEELEGILEELRRANEDLRRENEALTDTINRKEIRDTEESSPITSASDQLKQLKIKRIICKLCELAVNSVDDLREHAVSLEHLLAKKKYFADQQELSSMEEQEENE